MDWKKKIAIGAGLLATTTATIHLINTYIRVSVSQNKSLDYIPDLYYNWKFGEISYTKKGKGEPILLIHDLTTFSSGYEWHKVVESLSENNTVYCIDLLGCGNSDKPNILYTNFLYVQLITDFIKNVIGDKTIVVTTGESSAFALAACTNNSEIIHKIIMINPMDINILTKSPNRFTSLVTKAIKVPVFGTFLYNIFSRRSKVKSLFEIDYYYNYTLEENEISKVYYESAHSAGSKHLFASLAGFYTTLNVAHIMQSIKNDVAIIVGNELEEYKDIAEDYKDLYPFTEIYTIEETRYLPQLERPEKVVEIIRSFI